MAPLVADPGAADVAILTTSTPLVLEQVNYLDQLATFTEAFHLRIRTDAMANADAADLRVSIAVIALSVLGAALALALALFVTRFLGPFLNLHRRAEVVAAGELPPVPQHRSWDPGAQDGGAVVRRDVRIVGVDRTADGGARHR